MKRDRPCVVGLGELLWDVFPDRRFPGGAPANFAYHVVQQGGQGVVVSAIGEDPAGADLVSWLSEVGLEHGHVQVNRSPTERVSVTLNDLGQPSYHIHTEVAWDSIGWNAALAALAEEADCVCVGSLAQRSPRSRLTIQRFLAATRPACLRIFDVNIRDPHHDAEVLEQTLPLVNVLKLNAQEWPYVARHMNLNRDWSIGLWQLMRVCHLKFVALTRGENGSVLIDEQAAHEMLGEPVQVVDTIGAGDAFTATLAMGLLRGDDVGAIQRNAAAVASYVCTQSDATPSIPAALLDQIRPRPAATGVTVHGTDLVAATPQRPSPENASAGS